MLWFECKEFPPRLDTSGSFWNVLETDGSLQAGGTLGSLKPSRHHEQEGSEALCEEMATPGACSYF